MRARRVLEWGISSLSFVRPFVRPSFRRRFARPPSVWKRKDASACSTPGEGRCSGGALAVGRSLGLRLPWCKRARVHRSNVNGNGAFLRSSSHEATEVLLRWGKDGPRRRRRADGAEGRCLGRTPLESVEVVTVSETLSLKEKESAPRTCTPQGEMEERARAGNAAIDREGRCPLG